ncbi:MAG: DUF354 domain-containing protein [Bacteroidetes bacterium]|nr:DUF354 domain-containing protein [Bacteroidota bacterium]
MTYLISLGHPSQFHLFKNIISALLRKNLEVIVLITEKDILKKLVESSDIKYYAILPSSRRKSKLHLAFLLIRRFLKLLFIIFKTKPGILLGSETLLPICGRIFGIPSIVFTEDDSSIIPNFARIAFPYADCILSPTSCNVGKWDYKKIAYNGFQKLAYLHPNNFVANKSGIENFLLKPFYILRFSDLKAYHDKQKNGINYTVAKRLISELSKHGNVYISSERKLEAEFEPYRININLTQMHSLLSFAELYVGDSQSMAVESAILGIPGIRFNDFVGKIGVLDELEKKYHLTTGINSSDHDLLFKKVDEIITDVNSKRLYKERCNRMVGEKIDVLKFMLWFIENWPDSYRVMKNNPDYQYNFK